MNVISDTGPIIGFSRIGVLDIFEKIFGEIIIPEEVLHEILKGGDRPGSYEVQTFPWIKVARVKNRKAVERLMKVLGPGESAAIVLAKELDLPVLLDESEARAVAAAYGWDRIIGTCTVLLEAKKIGVIPEVGTIIEKLMSVNYRLNKDLIQDTLRRAAEL